MWLGELTLWVDVDGLVASGRMCADDRVLVDDGFSPLDAATGDSSVDLLDAGVCGFETVKALLEERTETLISLSGIHEESVTASVRAVKDVKEGSARRLLLIRDVRVPCDRARARLKERLPALIASTTVYKVNLGMALW